MTETSFHKFRLEPEDQKPYNEIIDKLKIFGTWTELRKEIDFYSDQMKESTQLEKLPLLRQAIKVCNALFSGDKKKASKEIFIFDIIKNKLDGERFLRNNETDKEQFNNIYNGALKAVEENNKLEAEIYILKAQGLDAKLFAIEFFIADRSDNETVTASDAKNAIEKIDSLLAQCDRALELVKDKNEQEAEKIHDFVSWELTMVSKKIGGLPQFCTWSEL